MTYRRNVREYMIIAADIFATIMKLSGITCFRRNVFYAGNNKYLIITKARV